MSKEQEINVKISGRVDPSFNKSVSAASQKMGELSKHSDEASNGFSSAEKSGVEFGEKSANAVSDLDAALASAGIIAVLAEVSDVFFECVEAADQYETALAKISTISDPTRATMTSIKDDITALSQETGQSVLELSESTYQAISASIDTAHAVEFVNEANMLAVGGFTDTTSAVDVLTTAINAYGLEVDKASAISDMLILTQKLGKTTVNELGSTLGTVIPTAAAYNVNMANISSSFAEMTKQGIDTANAGTYIRATLNELADSGSYVSAILTQKTGKSFSTLMSDGKSLGDIMQILGDSVEGDSTEFANLWGNTRAAQGALSLFNAGAEEFNQTVEKMENSAGTTSQAYSQMTSTAEHAEQVFINSVTNLQIAIGEQLSPMIENLYELGTEGLQLITAVVEEHPELVSAVTAITIGVGIFAGALVAYTVATKAAEKATIMFTAAMDTNPMFATLTVLISITTAVVAFVASMDNASKNAKELTETSKAQESELDKLKSKYEDVCKEEGKLSDEALDLKEKISDLTDEFEDSQITYGEMLAKQAELSDSIASMLEQDKTKELDTEAASADRLVTKLFNLAEQTSITSEVQEEMKAIIAKLNTEYEGLNLTYDDVVNKTADTKEALREYLEVLYNQKQYENAQTQWTETYDLLEQQKDQYLAMQAEVDAATDKYMQTDGNAQAYTEYENFWNKTIEYTTTSGETVKKTFKEAYDEACNNIELLDGELNKYEDTMLEISRANGEAAQSEKSWKDAASDAIQGVQGEIDKLAVAYDEAFVKAQQAIGNTVGLTTELTNETEITTSKLTETWENQIEWIEKYSENLKKAQQYGITDGLIESLSDGSETSGQYINQIITELDKLNANDAKELVDKLNKNFDGVKDAEGEFAKTVADYKEDFGDTMDGLKNKAQSTIEEMNLSAEAEDAAKKTIEAYVDEINAQIASASFTNAVDAVKGAVKKSLTPKGVFAYSKMPTLEQNAKGTKYSADIFLAGEQGPELVVNAKGSQVFTAAETQKILSGDANVESGDSTVTMLNIPELMSQLLAESASDKLSLEDMTQNLISEPNNNYDNSSTNSFTYAPTYQITGNSNSEIMESVRKTDKMSKSEFAKMMREYNKERSRVSFSGK